MTANVASDCPLSETSVAVSFWLFQRLQVDVLGQIDLERHEWPEPSSAVFFGSGTNSSLRRLDEEIGMLGARRKLGLEHDARFRRR